MHAYCGARLDAGNQLLHEQAPSFAKRACCLWACPSRRPPGGSVSAGRRFVNEMAYRLAKAFGWAPETWKMAFDLARSRHLEKTLKIERVHAA